MRIPGHDAAVAAVTSPLGTGIMVAVAVLLAIGLAVMSRVFTEQNEETPPVAFTKDETHDSLQVLNAEAGMMRSDLEVRLSVPGDFEVGGPVAAGPDALAASVFAHMGGAAGGPADLALAPGTTIHFCAEPGASAVRVEVRHAVSNTIILREDFLSLADCPG